MNKWIDSDGNIIEIKDESFKWHIKDKTSTNYLMWRDAPFKNFHGIRDWCELKAKNGIYRPIILFKDYAVATR